MYVMASRVQFKMLSMLQRLIWWLSKYLIRLHKTEGLHTRSYTKAEGYDYVLELWETKEDMLRFRRSGAHQHLMKKFRGWMNRVESIPFEASEIPTWDEVFKRFAERSTESAKFH